MNRCSNPGLLADLQSFRKHYQNPILRGREPDATEKEVQDSKTKSKALAAIVNNFIIRRTNKILVSRRFARRARRL